MKRESRKEEVLLAKLRIIPLGGLGEVGKNMTAFEKTDSSCSSI